MPVRRVSAVLVWALLLLVASLGSLPQGSLQDGSFAAAAGVDDAAIAASRAVGVVSAEQAPASSDGLLFVIAAAIATVARGSSSTAPTATSVFVARSQRYCSAQPRAPPTI
jgi:hypothetical protein